MLQRDLLKIPDPVPWPIFIALWVAVIIVAAGLAFLDGVYWLCRRGKRG